MAQQGNLSESRVLILGRKQEVLDGILRQLRELGMDVRGSTSPEHADTEFDAHEFDLIVFGSGAVGPLSERLRREFSRRNPAVRFLDAFAPVAIRQITAAASGRRELLEEFTTAADESGVRIGGTLRAASTVGVAVYRVAEDGLVRQELNRSPARAGRYEFRVAADALAGGHMLVVNVGEDEFHLHRIAS
ncbi:hypothetical protein [Amycolatopsis anabasis]|uniref:hypothetical protein n=1 Tax=Amycolatopsis anabasis TaxID=1840409 RepID=UPI00131B681F|nr:hypothetical protein [Amycolatopsis anabasis]